VGARQRKERKSFAIIGAIMSDCNDLEILNLKKRVALLEELLKHLMKHTNAPPLPADPPTDGPGEGEGHP
jgi:hypothetical protein